MVRWLAAAVMLQADEISRIGEKFLDWTDVDPSIDTILEAVTLYWLTQCAHTNLWSYRHVSTATPLDPYD
jgi:hypothetical protein